MAPLHFTAHPGPARVDRRRCMDLPGAAGRSRQPRRAPIAHCIECGCHDAAACWDEAVNQPCSWIRLNARAGLGVCSACPDAARRWDAGDRSVAVPL